MWFTDSHLAFRQKASDLSNRTSKILTVLLHASKCSFHVLVCMLFPYKFWSGGCLTLLPWSWVLVRKLNTQMFPNSLASFNMLWPHLSSGLCLWSFETVYISPWLLVFFTLLGTNSSSAFLCSSIHWGLYFIMGILTWHCQPGTSLEVLFFSGLKRKKKASLCFDKPQLSFFKLDSSFINVIYCIYRLPVSGSGCSCSAYSALWTYWFKNYNKKHCRAAVLCNLLLLCLSNSILYHCEQKKKNKKRLLFVTGINLNGGSGERSSVSAGEDMSYFGMKQFWL